MSKPARYSLDSYTGSTSGTPVFCVHAKANFSPLDINLAFLVRSGWNQSIDRLRLHTENPSDVPPGGPLAEILDRLHPHLLIRRLDREEDSFAAVRASIDD